DDAVEVGMELRVSELVTSEVVSSLGGIQFRVGRAKVLERHVVVGARSIAVFEQLAQSPFGCLSLRQYRLGCDNVGLRRFHLVVIVPLIEPGERVTFLDYGADVDMARDDLARHPKADIAFIARPDLAYCAAVVVDRLEVDDHRANRPHLWHSWRSISTARGRESNAEHQQS